MIHLYSVIILISNRDLKSVGNPHTYIFAALDLVRKNIYHMVINTLCEVSMEGYIFDLDGTLIDSTGVWRDIDLEFLARYGKNPTDEYIRFVSNNPLNVCAQYTIQYYSLSLTADEIISQWLQMSDDKYRYEIQLKPYAREFLTQCAELNIRMSIATSCTPRHCNDVLARTGISDFFDCISTVECVGKTKAFPDVYLHAAHGMGLEPNNCTVFEDSQDALEVVQKAGFSFIGVHDELSHQDNLRGCCRFIMDFGELLTK